MPDKYYDWTNYLIEEDRQCILWNKDRIINYEYESEGSLPGDDASAKVLWTYEPEKTLAAGNTTDSGKVSRTIQKVLLSPDKKHLFSIYYSDQAHVAMIEEIDVSKGSVQKTFTFEGDFQGAFGYAGSVSSDGRFIAITGQSGSPERIEKSLCVFDLDHKTAVRKTLEPIDPWGSYLADDILFIDNSQILVSGYNGKTNVSRKLDEEHHADLVGSSKYLSMYCYDCAKSRMIWNYSTGHDSADESPGKENEESTKQTELDMRSLWNPSVFVTEIDGTKTILTSIGNTLVMTDAKNGRCLKIIHLDAKILLLEQTPSSIRLILENGTVQLLSKSFDIDTINLIKCFPPDISLVCNQADCYYLICKSDPAAVIKYETGIFDESYRKTNIYDNTQAELIKQLPESGEILKDSKTELQPDEERKGFRIVQRGGSRTESCKVNTDEDILRLSLTPDGSRIIVGLKSSIQLYDLNGSLLGETDLPAKIYGINDQNITFFFPDKDSLFYGDIQNGFLLDILSEQLEVIKQMKYVVGFDQDTREFILNDMHKKGDEGALSIEYFKYHTLNEIRKLAEE